MDTEYNGFAGFDAGVFRQWAMGLSDVLANCRSDHCAPESINAAGGLIYQLVKCADELDEIERQQMKAKEA